MVQPAFDPITDIGNLEPFPLVALRILDLCTRNTDPCELAAVVRTDVGVSAKVLRLANSALCGLAVPIESIADALHYLGPRRVANLAMTTGANAFLTGYGDSTPRSNSSLWKESYYTALFAHAIARRVLPPDEVELAYTVGLMQNLGHVVMDRFLVERRDAILALRQNGEVEPLVAERCILGIDHARCAQLIGRQWGLPARLQRGMLMHHTPASAGPERALCEVVNVAEHLTFEYTIDGATSLTFPISPDSALLMKRLSGGIGSLTDEVHHLAAESEGCLV